MVGPLIVNDEKLTVRDVLNSRRDLESCISFTILKVVFPLLFLRIFCSKLKPHLWLVILICKTP